jgi:hypothetical protein
LLGGQRSRRASRQEDLHLETDQFSGELGETIVPSLSPPVLDKDILPLDVAEVTKTLAECIDEMAFKRKGRVPKVADPWDLLPLLGLSHSPTHGECDTESNNPHQF